MNIRLLLDTHALLWWLANDRKLPRDVRETIADPANEVFVSAASVWEISIKRALGRLELDTDDLEQAVVGSGFQPLPISFAHAVAVGGLPPVHRDPFDRMIVAQSRVERLRIVTHDRVFERYGLTGEGILPLFV